MINENIVSEIQKKLILNKDPFPNTIIKDTLPLELMQKAEKDFISFDKFFINGVFRYGRPKFSFQQFEEMPPSIKKYYQFFLFKTFSKDAGR
jgi:hypothetical protein